MVKRSKQRVQRDGPLPLSLALEVVEQTARGLAAGEECGVIHRDLKPSNLMIESTRRRSAVGQDHRLRRSESHGCTTMRLFGRKQGSLELLPSPVRSNLMKPGQQQIDTRSDIYARSVSRSGIC